MSITVFGMSEALAVQADEKKTNTPPALKQFNDNLSIGVLATELLERMAKAKYPLTPYKLQHTSALKKRRPLPMPFGPDRVSDVKITRRTRTITPDRQRHCNCKNIYYCRQYGICGRNK
jgi:hypothetical protein